MYRGDRRGKGTFWLVLGLMVIVMMALTLASCGKKQEVETDPTDIPPVVGETEQVPEPVEPEVTEPDPATALPDYTTMEPVEFGVEDVFFAFDKYDLTPEAMAVLAANARIMREIGDVTILLEGHTDERGTVEYNLALGERRALAVRDYLTSLGVSSWRLRVTSYGESRPFAYGSSEESWALNRRVHFARP